MKKIIFLLMLNLFIYGCVAATQQKPMQGYEGKQYVGDYKSLIINAAKEKHYKWNNIYIEIPVKTVNGWSGRFVITHSGTFDDLLQYNINDNGYVDIKKGNGLGGIDEIDKIKHNVNNYKSHTDNKNIDSNNYSISNKEISDKNKLDIKIACAQTPYRYGTTFSIVIVSSSKIKDIILHTNLGDIKFDYVKKLNNKYIYEATEQSYDETGENYISQLIINNATGVSGKNEKLNLKNLITIEKNMSFLKKYHTDYNSSYNNSGEIIIKK